MTCLDIMTSDTKPQARPETFRSHLPAIVAATTGTVLAAILGSLIGAAGTIAGIVIGSLASGTASWWAERGIRRSAALAAARAEAIRVRGYPLHPGGHASVTQAAVITRDTAAAGSGHDRPRPRLRWRWAGPAAFIIAAFIGGALVVTLLEGAAGKPLSAVVQGKPGHGTTLGGGTVGKAAPASPSRAYAVGQRDRDRHRQHHAQQRQQFPGGQHCARYHSWQQQPGQQHAEFRDSLCRADSHGRLTGAYPSPTQPTAGRPAALARFSDEPPF